MFKGEAYRLTGCGIDCLARDWILTIWVDKFALLWSFCFCAIEIRRSFSVCPNWKPVFFIPVAEF
ncbi:MAG: hypothetical protein LBK06_08555 [Planctomycetaceae bacterium]|nr:hypothetical protein [Planctomycetaceae bacterium]